ncbi:MAG TPA: hypothetical protein PLI59_11230 [Candidatus Obscuribacter sp.]|nr:hypothetical protein [Candidatus Obscuribacter sp.]MBK9278499.1 hypothetical protein [Candidatus Obscuribacter sp.]MBL8082519.1 hypothetical protein [Candidatus Obscuribacter sp.]HNG19740.1 hypothetical protein [Candidatus Obscuribacter sp.]
MSLKTKNSGKTLPTCAFVTALAVFLTLNLGLAISRPLTPLKASALPAKASWECQRALRFQKDSADATPDVVLFGSSLMMIPTTCAEADFQGKIIDPVLEPYSNKLSQLLKAKGRLFQRCFNFALPGAVISDHYLVSKALFKENQRPRLVVLGITLRDFMDCGVDSVAATPAYNYFHRYLSEAELDAMVQAGQGGPWQNRDYLVNKWLYIYGRRLELQNLIETALNGSTTAALKSLKLPREGNPALTFEELSKPRAAGVSGNKNNIDALMAAQEVKPGNFLILPNMQLPWQDNTREYKKRFAHKNEAVFKGQFAILDKLLALNESLGIETLIVNMPVTPMNMKLMPKGSYESYSAALNTVAQKRQVKVLDLNGTFDMSCFRDTVHMNGKGGAALLQAIAATLSEDKREQLSGKAPLPF